MDLDRPHPALSETEADRRIEADRRDLTALLAKADCRMSAGDLKAANAFYGAVAGLARQGVPIGRADAARVEQALSRISARMQQALFDSLEKDGFPADKRSPRVQKSLEIMLGQRPRDPEPRPWPQQPLNYFLPDTQYCEFADSEQWKWVAALREAAPAIQAEAEALMADGETFRPYVARTTSRPQGDVHGMLENADWSTFDLTRRGQPIPERVERCPITWQAVSAHAPLCHVVNRAPSVMFSLLRPHSRIPPHTGMLNTRLICHLPLVVPPNCAIRVGGQVRTWRKGELLAFDDTVEHEAWNDSDENRLVLIFDIWRPELTEAERAQINALFAAVDSV